MYFIKKLFLVINCFILIYKEVYISQLKKNKGKIKNIENINITNKLEIDNEIRFISYEENVDFSKYSTNVKIIALYLPNFNSLNFLKNCIPKYKGHHQPRIQDKRYINNYNLENYYLVKKQIQLAKSHGIYGFGIYFYWFSGKTIFDKPLNFIYKSIIKFNYMLIWKNEEVKNEKNVVILKVKYEKNDPENFILYIKKYLLDHRYIRIKGKPIIGIFAPKKIPKLKETITIWRKKSIEFGIGKIIIISALTGINITELIDMKLFDGAYKTSTNDLFFKRICKNTIYNYIYYYGIFYTNIISNEKNENFPVYKSIMMEYDNSPITQKANIFGGYSPELFYILNKFLIHQINNNYNQLNNFLFINAWNNYYEGTYLEPDSKYGYSSLNSLSKALFNLPFKTIHNNLSYLITNCSVAIQVHVFYDDLIDEIINKTNNILVKFDLYITTDNNKKMAFINQYIKKRSKANKYNIKIVKNKGRDVIPFLIQMNDIIKKYKYFCHIHSKKHISKSAYGMKWRHYLYANLLGNKELIQEIISDFENYNKLGIIFPETFYQAVPFTMHVRKSTKKKMDYLINKLFHGTKIGDKYFDFPAGNMFWARNEAVYQIFQKNIIQEIINKGITNPILWAIERLWLFIIIKLNGFYYKKYFKFF
jgi:hypothetical protein